MASTSITDHGARRVQRSPSTRGGLALALRGADLDVSVSAVGLLISAYAIGVVVGAPTLTAVGPGSYTGIRIAATIGKMLSYALSIPLIGVSTLETFIPQNIGDFDAVLLATGLLISGSLNPSAGNHW